jgi:hypothetical protein
MRVHARVWVLALLVGVLTAVFASAAAAASLEVERFVAQNCKSEAEHAGSKKCGSEESAGPLGTPYSIPKSEVTVAEAKAEGFTQAGGRVPNGVTDFKVKTEGEYPNAKPVGGVAVNHVRVDVARGLATAPVAVPMCSAEEFGASEALPETGLYTAPKCKAETIIGEEKVTLYVEALKEFGFTDLPLEGTVYNLVQPEGLASYYGVALEFPKVLTEVQLGEVFKGSQPAIEKEQYYVHSFVKGSVEWGKQAAGTEAADYHDYFEVEASPADPLISSRQVLYGTSGEGDFITNATSCPGDDTTYVTLKDTAGETTRTSFTTPIGLSGCSEVPFLPSFALTPESFAHDEAVGVNTEVGMSNEEGKTATNVPTKIASSELKTASFTLPEGMTLNPSAAPALEACTPADARINSSEPGTKCPAASAIGTVELEVPTLPAGSLKGNIYLGGEASGRITKPPYTIYLDAESARYGISVRLEGKSYPNESTGQVTTVFSENPAQPFTKAILKFKGGEQAPIASPLSCGSTVANASFAPFTETASKTAETAPFSVTGCPSTLPFTLAQSAPAAGNAGAATSFTFNLERADGQQYLSQESTVLPEGLVGYVPDVKECGEAEIKAEEASASTGGCSAETEIGTATVEAGAGKAATFQGHVYYTGPYDGAPYGMVIVVPATSGPFELGNVVTRATINVNQLNARITVASTLPTIYKGVPLRVRKITVAVTRPGFIHNPTNCSPLLTESTLVSTMNATQSVSSPFQVANCSALAFKPAFGARSSAKTSKANGASLETTLNLPAGDANVKSVLVQLPLQLPSRLTTLQKACPEATFAANPYGCPIGSFVGGARANTPALPNKMSGPAILVSHGGEAFPDLDLVLEADNVRVILVGHTKITKGITTTDFAETPDVPVTSITVNLPLGAHSSLAANGELCPKPLTMPTTIVGQNGVTFTQKTPIKVVGCGVRIAGHKVVGNIAYITVQTFAPGRVSGSGKNLATVYEHFSKAKKTATLKVPLSRNGRRRGRPFKVKLRVGFLPTKKGEASTAAFATVNFR